MFPSPPSRNSNRISPQARNRACLPPERDKYLTTERTFSPRQRGVNLVPGEVRNTTGRTNLPSAAATNNVSLNEARESMPELNFFATWVGKCTHCNLISILKCIVQLAWEQGPPATCLQNVTAKVCIYNDLDSLWVDRRFP